MPVSTHVFGVLCRSCTPIWSLKGAATHPPPLAVVPRPGGRQYIRSRVSTDPAVSGGLGRKESAHYIPQVSTSSHPLSIRLKFPYWRLLSTVKPAGPGSRLPMIPIREEGLFTLLGPAVPFLEGTYKSHLWTVDGSVRRRFEQLIASTRDSSGKGYLVAENCPRPFAHAHLADNDNLTCFPSEQP